MALTYIRPVPGPITAPFNEQRSYEVHEGVDIGCPVGTNVLAAADGKVSFAALNGTYGNVIYIDHPDGGQTRYAHLSKFQVSNGAQVRQGQVIALSGGAAGAAGSGNSTGPHLHHEHRVNGVPQDPTKWWAAGDQGNTTVTPIVDNNSGDSGGLPGAINGSAAFFNFIGNGSNWVRIGIGSLGVALLIIVIVNLFTNSSTGQTIISGTKSAAGVAKKAATLAAVA